MAPTDPIPADPAFRLKSAARIRAGWLQRDLLFLTRSLRYLLRPQGERLRRAAGLEAGEIGILAVVGQNPGMSQNDLAASVVLKKSAVTRIVQSLEQRELLVRSRSQTDRRVNCLSLTPQGQRIIDGVQQATRAMQHEWFADIPPDRRAAFFEVMTHLVDQLAETPPPEDAEDDA